MQYFQPRAFDYPNRKKKLVAIWAAIALAAGGVTALSVTHTNSRSAISLTSQDVVPPSDGHQEPLDGGSTLVSKAGDGKEVSDFLAWLLGIAGSPGENKPPHPAASESPKKSPKHGSSAKGHWIPPVENYVITARYGQPGDWAAGHHTGIDLAVPVGTEIKSIGKGTVMYATLDDDYGNYALIHQDDGFYVLYAHMSKLMVRTGEKVKGEQRLGLSGATGRVTGPHLHFEVRSGPAYGSDVDPVAYMRRHGVTL